MHYFHQPQVLVFPSPCFITGVAVWAWVSQTKISINFPWGDTWLKFQVFSSPLYFFFNFKLICLNGNVDVTQAQIQSNYICSRFLAVWEWNGSLYKELSYLSPEEATTPVPPLLELWLWTSSSFHLSVLPVPHSSSGSYWFPHMESLWGPRWVSACKT